VAKEDQIEMEGTVIDVFYVVIESLLN